MTHLQLAAPDHVELDAQEALGAKDGHAMGREQDPRARHL